MNRKYMYLIKLHKYMYMHKTCTKKWLSQILSGLHLENLLRGGDQNLNFKEFEGALYMVIVLCLLAHKFQYPSRGEGQIPCPAKWNGHVILYNVISKYFYKCNNTLLSLCVIHMYMYLQLMSLMDQIHHQTKLLNESLLSYQMLPVQTNIDRVSVKRLCDIAVLLTCLASCSVSHINVDPNTYCIADFNSSS